MQTTPRGDAPPSPTTGDDRHGACRDCGEPLRNAVVCELCGALNRNPVPSDPFTLLGLAEEFEMNPAALRSTYRAVARRVHPDRFTGADDETRALAARLSAETNHAYQVLSDPVRRADFLLVRAGGPTSTTLREVPAGLLAETMTLREEIETAKDAGDAAALERNRVAISARRRDALEQIAAAAARLPACDDAQMATLRRQLNAMKYYDNLLAELAGDPLGRTG